MNLIKDYFTTLKRLKVFPDAEIKLEPLLNDITDRSSDLFDKDRGYTNFILFNDGVYPSYNYQIIDGNTNSFYIRDKLQRINGPSYVERYDNITIEKYYSFGKLHRINKPAVIHYENHIVTREEYYLDDTLHRDNGPAVIQYLNNKIIREEYYLNNMLHRLNSPAVIQYENGNITKQEYWKQGKLYNDKGPAVIRYKNGKVIAEEYHMNDKHPAVIKYGDKITFESYYVNGKCKHSKIEI